MQPDYQEPVSISPRIREVIEILFPEVDWGDAEDLIVHECGSNMPFWNVPGELERIRLAALRLSRGRLDRLVDAISLGQTDYRDLLMAAGFGENVRSHLKWHPGQDR